MHWLVGVTGLETRYRSMRRQLAGGHLARQNVAVAVTDRTTLLRAVEVVRIPGLLQTADHARHVFTANSEFRQISHAGLEDSVRARLRRQAALYEPGRSFRMLIWEGAL
ncbi:Scr1 family TA system antitoxin-like transcriptional regulator [Streptomyces sp. NPDC048508]|uniref:Scr1 family TA system antitoxin-like transcriptional regulator n=1 Tax=Streptomyces sp. NPDC048508 TaxID=3365561 RepID=UPI0037222A2D